MQEPLSNTLSPTVRLSPSRIDSYTTCSWNYFCGYVQKMPNFDNDGSRRGTVCHNLLEHLCVWRHRRILEEVLSAGCPFLHPTCSRYLSIWSKKVDLDLDKKVVNLRKTGFDTNKELVSSMVMVALDNDFLGTDDAEGCEVEVIPEQVHEIKSEKEGLTYHIKGIVDKTIIKRSKKDGEVVSIDIVDYKTSKQKFDKKKIDSNIQAMTYQFFARKVFPNIKNLNLRFLFLRFPKQPWVETFAMSSDHVIGYEVYLSKVSEFLSTFNKSNALSNMARFNNNQHLCGKDGFKEIYDKEQKKKVPTDEPHWKCPYKEPFDYFIISDPNGKTVKAFEKDKKPILSQEEIDLGFEVRSCRYEGCPAWGYKSSKVSSDVFS